MDMEELKKQAWVKWLAAALVAAIGAFAGVSYVEAGEVVVVEVPDGKKVVLVDKRMPKNCVSVKGWKLEMPVVSTQAIPKECEGYGELVVSPSSIPAYCADYFPKD